MYLENFSFGLVLNSNTSTYACLDGGVNLHANHIFKVHIHIYTLTLDLCAFGFLRCSLAFWSGLSNGR